MISQHDLRKIAKARLADSVVLHRGGRYDGAIYMCGYAVETALKARICRVLRWPGFPSTGSEFHTLQSFKTHDLDVLLKLSGAETRIRSRFLAEWSLVGMWDPEVRYRPIGSATAVDGANLIAAVRTLLSVL